jgi:aldehyde dehydrogenase (NAD+)
MKDIKKVLQELGISDVNNGVSTGVIYKETIGGQTVSVSPIDNSIIAKINNATIDDYEFVIEKAQNAFQEWRNVPAPKRGEIVRQIGDELRKNKENLAILVSYEMGKIYTEALGEIQEMIDICDFAVGQSRMLNGFTMRSERSQHKLSDQYHSLGIVGLITSFNFPVAVWAWNSMIAAIAGDVVVWKPSSKTPLTAIAVQNVIAPVLKNNNVPEGVFNLIIAKSSVLGDNFVADKRIPLFSVTGSTSVGKRIGAIVGQRLGKVILELGGNNAVIISDKADIDMAINSTVFGAVGTSGQRCTSTRRLIVQESIYEQVKQRLIKAYEVVSTKIGNPVNPSSLLGPLIDSISVNEYLNALEELKKEGGKILFGGKQLSGAGFESGNYVLPTLAEAENHYKIVQEETFAPILYLMNYKTIEEAISLNNGVPQGLSSAIFSNDMREVELFVSETGSDCGIANINIGTSGAEIGGAFGGEKETGGGRESGSDAWKAYMRRQTNTVNYGRNVQLAQGVSFGF